MVFFMIWMVLGLIAHEAQQLPGYLGGSAVVLMLLIASFEESDEEEE